MLLDEWAGEGLGCAALNRKRETPGCVGQPPPDAPGVTRYVVFGGTKARKRFGLSTRILCTVASFTPA